MNTLKEKIEKRLEKIILARFPGEGDIVQFSEKELIKTILSLFESYQSEQVKAIKGLKYKGNDVMALSGTPEGAGMEMRNIILDQVLSILTKNDNEKK